MSFSQPARVQLPLSSTVTALLKVTADGTFEAAPHDPASEHPVTFVTALPAAEPGGWSATYTAATARAAAGQLLGFVHRIREHETGAAFPEEIAVSPLEPDSRTRTSSRWSLETGVTLVYVTPFTAFLDVPAPRSPRILTESSAELWARALLGLARELDHAQVVATHAIRADRAGEEPTTILRRSVLYERDTLTGSAREYANSVLDELSDLDSQRDEQRRVVALGQAHGDLREQLDAAYPHDVGSVSHLDVAHLVTELCRRHAVPVVTVTARSREILAELPDGTELTEQQWRQVARSNEMLRLVDNFNEMFGEDRIITVDRALREAGVLCRGDSPTCEILLTGTVAETWGHCPPCRPATLTEALALGCSEYVKHDLPRSHDGACRTCQLPLNPEKPEVTA